MVGLETNKFKLPRCSSCKHMRPTSPFAGLAAVGVFTLYIFTAAFTLRALARRLGYHYTPMPFTDQAEIFIFPVFSRPLAPATGLWRVLDDRHNHDCSPLYVREIMIDDSQDLR